MRNTEEKAVSVLRTMKTHQLVNLVYCADRYVDVAEWISLHQMEGESLDKAAWQILAGTDVPGLCQADAQLLAEGRQGYIESYMAGKKSFGERGLVFFKRVRFVFQGWTRLRRWRETTPRLRLLRQIL